MQDTLVQFSKTVGPRHGPRVGRFSWLTSCEPSIDQAINIIAID